MREHQSLQLMLALLFGIWPFALVLPSAFHQPTMWDFLWLPLQGGVAWFCARHWLFPWLSWLRHRREPLDGLGPGLLADVAWSRPCEPGGCSWLGDCARSGECAVPAVLHDRPLLDDANMTWCTADDRWRVRMPNGQLRYAMVSQLTLRPAVEQLGNLAQ